MDNHPYQNAIHPPKSTMVSSAGLDSSASVGYHQSVMQNPAVLSYFMERSNNAAAFTVFSESKSSPSFAETESRSIESQEDRAIQALHGIMALSDSSRCAPRKALQPITDPTNLPPPPLTTLPKKTTVRGPRLALFKNRKPQLRTSRAPTHPWTKEEDAILRKLVKGCCKKDWRAIAAHFPKRSNRQCFHRWKRTLDPAITKGKWSKEEDERLRELVEKHGDARWSKMSEEVPGRTGKQCRERWVHHLQPNVSKSHTWSEEEDLLLLYCYMQLGSCWSLVARLIPGRTDNCVKNHFYLIKKRFVTYLAEMQGVPVPMIRKTAEGHIDFMGDLDGVLASSRRVRRSDLQPYDTQSLDQTIGAAQNVPGARRHGRRSS